MRLKMNGSSNNETHVNARGLLCPLPIIHTQNQAKKLANNSILVLHCTDINAPKDIESWCNIKKHKLVSTKHNNNEICITIQIKKEP